MAGAIVIDQRRAKRRFEQIIGESAELRAVLEQVERVAPTDSTVLIQGETGTGKELIAHAVHNVSPRCGRPFIRLNCAAIPFDLLESELFGHERGAFTGAITQKLGRFELADKGTLFLDEVGDIPVALQPKLLRVLQEREFERLGSSQTRRVDVRLVAATHRDLRQMAERDEFRSDLYYRLNVFPIVLPALRQRRDDIAPLATHFVGMLSRRMGKGIRHIPAETMAALESYSWPGNIRELENLIERAVILADDGILPNLLQPNDTSDVVSSATDAPSTIPRSAGPPIAKDSAALTTLRESERSLILRTLETTGWVVGGAGGAAIRLGLKRTTLVMKMKKLGIERSGFRSSDWEIEREGVGSRSPVPLTEI
jgi:formate hydrogenlyase transcriptional activator